MSNTFVHELPLKTDSHMEKVIDTRFDLGGMLYNSVLHEALNKISLIKQSKLWQKAKKAKKNRSKLFKDAIQAYGFTDYSLQKFAITSKNKCAIGIHLDTHVCQKIATRAYLAADQYIKNIRGRPRYKRKGWISSLEGKTNDAGIRFKDGFVHWRKLKIYVIYDRKDPDAVEAHALNSRVKYCRIVRKIVKEKKRYFIQLILEGKPLIKQKNDHKNAVVGLDMGPSTIAIFSCQKAELKAFCEGLEPLSKEMGKLQKKMDRKRRLLNPENYEESGVIKKGKLFWKRSKHYQKKKNLLSEAYRKLKEYRKRLQGRLANQICGLGNHIKIEKISYKAWQRIFGKSVAKTAPAMFLNILHRKVENTGGQLEEFSTIQTCLSQICHLCEIKLCVRISL